MTKDVLLAQLGRLVDDTALTEQMLLNGFHDDPEVVKVATMAAQNMAGFIETLERLSANGQ